MLLVLVMVIGMIPFSALSASAATSGTGTETDPYVVTTYEELMTLMKESSTAYIKLGCNIAPENTTNELYTIYVFGNKTLDLNGYSLTRIDYATADTSMIEVRSGGSLTINDTSSAKTGSIDSTGSNMCTTILIVFGGSLIMNEGYVNGYCTRGSAYAAIVSKGSVTVNGGTYASSNMSGLSIEGGTCTIYDGNFVDGVTLWGGNTNIYGGVFGNEDGSTDYAISIDGENDTGSTPSAYIYNATFNAQLFAVEFDNLTLKNCVINNRITIWKSRQGAKPAIRTFLADGFSLYLDGVLSTATDTRYEASKIEVKFNGNLNMGFSSLTPTPDMDEADWDELASDLGTMALGSADTNITFNFFAKALSADAIEAGYSVKRALKVTRDGITVYDKEYASNELLSWNLKDNIDEGGNYHIIPTLNYYLDGVKVEEISHLYTVKVTGSTIKTISLAGIGTPVIGSAPSHAEFAFSNTDGVIIKKLQWEYWTSEMGGGFVNMPDGSVFEEGKRYAVLLELKSADGYLFAANKEDMTVYINGQKANLTYNYTNNEFGVELEMTPITTPAFIVKPVGGNVAEGEKFTITWETNFKPAWIEILSFNSANGAPNKAIDVPADATSFELDANEFGYVLNVYYNGNQCVSNGEKFYVNEIKHISEINVTVAPPKAGEAPADATTTESGYTISTQWWVLEEDGQYRPFEGDFEAGKQYAVYTLIKVKAGYELANNPTIKVNGDSDIIRISSSKEFYSCVYEFITINSIELEVAKPVIGEAPTKPTIKSVNGDENLKDLVSFFNDAKVYWVEADSAEDIANGNKHPTVFADGKIYALHVAIQTTKEFAEDCVLNVYGTDGELLWSGNISFSDPSDKTLVYTDAYLGNFKLEIGNVNGDDLIDFTDLQRLYQHITGDSPLSGDALGAADVNADTVIDFSDLQALFALLSQNA